MSRSKQRKIRREAQSDLRLPRRSLHSMLATGLPPLTSAIIACLNTAQAEEAASGGTLEEVVVSAQKRTESLQNVPLSITALGTQKLDELNVQNVDDYIKFLPSVSYQSTGPGSAKLYMRGVSSGGDGVHSGSPPSVGVYLDEQPVTTIQGMLDLHMYDIARVEALAGPQGTLYGASSEAGTLRIITNKPEFNVLTGAYDVQGNDVDHGGVGYTGEGFINVPIGSVAAIRLVGWYEKDAGYLDNVPGSITYPATYSNGAQVTVGQLALASIANPQSLVSVGDNNLQVSAASAAPAIGAPNSGGLGQVMAGSLESSTVDIATEFTQLIALQQAYQANSKIVTTVDQLAQSTIALIQA